MLPDPRQVAYRFAASTELSGPLQEGIKAYLAGQGPSKIQDGFEVILTAIGGPQGAGTFLSTGRMPITTDWYHALAPKEQGWVQKILWDIQEVGAWILVKPPGIGIEVRLGGIVRAVQKLSKFIRDDAKDVKHGPYTIVKMPGVRNDMAEALAALDDATKIIQRRFPQVTYGIVFISAKLVKAVAQYSTTNDAMYLSTKAKDSRGDIYIICHELGHRYAHRFWKDTNAQLAFQELSKTIAITPYGATKWTENFAEAFAHLVLGRPLPAEIQAIMDGLT